MSRPNMVSRAQEVAYSFLQVSLNNTRAAKGMNDGACFGNPGIAGRGDLIRESMGRFVMGFNLVEVLSLKAELWAMRDGLQPATQPLYKSLIIVINHSH